MDTIFEQEEYSIDDPTKLSASERAISQQREIRVTSSATSSMLSEPTVITDNEDMNLSSTAAKEQNLDAEQRIVYEEQTQAGLQPSCVNNVTNRQIQNNNFMQRECCPRMTIEHVENVLVLPTASRKSSVIMNEESCIMFKQLYKEIWETSQQQAEQADVTRKTTA